MRQTWFHSILVLLAAASFSFAQLPVTDGLELWLDATDTDSLILNGGFVDQWSDKSGNNFHAVPALDAGAPTWTSDAMNGMPSVRFAAETADGMDVERFFIDERPYTAFVVNQYWGDVRGRTLQGADSNWLLGLWAGNVGHYAEGWVTPQQPARENFVYVADAVGTETESFATFNGLDYTNDSAPLGSPGGLGLVGAGAFAGELSDADISEVIFYDRTLSGAELGSVRGYLHDKYGATVCATVHDCVGHDEQPLITGSVFPFTSSGSIQDDTNGIATQLDFSGDFAYGINVGGPNETDDFEPLTIGDVTLVAGTNEDEPNLNEAGVTMTVANEIADWFSAAVTDFGEGTDDDENLGFAMQSIRWNQPPGIDITMEVEEGQSYKLQMLFGEACCNRGFDIFLEDELVVDNLLIHEIQGGINNGDTGVAYTHEFTAGDIELNITLGGVLNGAPDNSPILHVLTLEKIESLVPVCHPDTGGDVDGNGKVEFADLLILSGHLNEPFPPLPADAHTVGDIDCNGQVEFADFLVLSGNFGNEVGGAESVPEPAGLSGGLIGLSTIMSLRRRLR